MPIISYKNVGITAMAACIPQRVIDNYSYGLNLWPKQEIKKVVDKVGVYERRFVDEKTCSSDLCFYAAEKIFADNNIDRDDVELLIFLSQTPDYRMPSTSILLQDRLKLPKSTLAFDVNLGCSGFIPVLSIVYAMMGKNGFRKALILDGETNSKVYSAKDRREAFIFGDAGVAAIVERNEKFGTSYFSNHSDGSRGDLIMIPAGGYRNRSSIETLTEKIVDEYGNVRSEEQGSMNGNDVFNFVIEEVPKDIRYLLENVGENIEDLDYYIFHQANMFINKYLVKKLDLNPNKIPWTISKFGNTASVSVPLTIVSELKGKLGGCHKLLLSAFGVGMAWSSAIIPFVDCKISDIVEI